MPGRIYRVPFSGTITNSGADADLVVLEVADDKPIQLIGFTLGQYSETGDAAEENIRLTIRHMTATVTVTGGTSVTPVPNRPGTDTAAGFTAKCNCSTVTTTSGTSTLMEDLAWNERATPWQYFFPDEMRPRATQGEALILRWESTVADDLSAAFTILVEEF